MKCFSLWPVLVLPVIVVSCVPAKKFNDMKAAYESEKSKSEACSTNLATANAELANLKERLDAAGKQIKFLQADSTDTHSQYTKYKKLHDDLNESYEKLLKNCKVDQDRLSSELKDLEAKLLAKEAELNKKEDLLNDREKKNNELMAATSRMQDDLNKKQQKVDELTRMINAKDSAVNALKNSLMNSLLAYKNNGIDVSVKNGKVYVSMDEKLLFASGSIVVDAKGKQALLDFAKAINSQPDVTIMIEGHTDNVPMKSSTIRDNWDLSVLRATSIVRILSADGKVDPKRIIASGRAEFFPLSDSNTAEARAKNRRTEIIITPKLDELFKILGN